MNVCNSPVLLDYIQTAPLEVCNLFSTLNCHTANASDMICPHLLKKGTSKISCSLSNLFNKSLQDLVLPVDWVSANVCLVYKRGDKQSVSNYCPISIVSNFRENYLQTTLYHAGIT